MDQANHGDKNWNANQWTHDSKIPNTFTAYFQNNANKPYSFKGADVSYAAGNTTIPESTVITWTSVEKCEGESSADSKLNIVLRATEANATTAAPHGTWGLLSKKNKCNYEFTYSGPHVHATEIPINHALNAIAPFLGIIFIVFGLLMTFWGSKFLFIVFGVIIGAVVTAVLFLLANTLFLGVQSSTGLVIGTVIGCILLGAGTAFLTYKFTKAFVVQILAGVTGALLVMMVAQTFHLRGWALIGSVVGGAVFGIFIGHQLRFFVRAVATALIGSFFIMRGVGCYAPGFPSAYDVEDVKHANNYMIGYLAGFVLLTVIGSFYQLKYVQQEESDSDEFKGEDEGKVCGCF
jgi:hypothetical protein